MGDYTVTIMVYHVFNIYRVLNDEPRKRDAGDIPGCRTTNT